MLSFIKYCLRALLSSRKRGLGFSADRKDGKEWLAIKRYLLCITTVLCAFFACSEDTVGPTSSPPPPVTFPFISYCNETSGAIWCAARVNGSWDHTSISYSNDKASYTAIAIDAQGNPQIIYQEIYFNEVSPLPYLYINVQGYLKSAKMSGNAWNIEVIEKTIEYEGPACAGMMPELSASLSIDANGCSHIIYDKYDINYTEFNSLFQSNAYLKYAVKDGEEWKIEEIPQTNNFVEFYIIADDYGHVCSPSGGLPRQVGALALDTHANPHSSYLDGPSGDLKYAVKVDSDWQQEIIDAGVGAPQWTSIILDAQDKPHVAYYDASAAALKYAVKINGGWELEFVDTGGGNVGLYATLALDHRGYPHICYYDASNRNLRYAVKIDGFWIIEMVDSFGYSGARGTSLAIDAEGNPHIAYFEALYGDLKHAVKIDGSWTIESVDCWATTGVYPSIALSSQ